MEIQKARAETSLFIVSSLRLYGGTSGLIIPISIDASFPVLSALKQDPLFEDVLQGFQNTPGCVDSLWTAARDINAVSITDDNFLTARNLLSKPFAKHQLRFVSTQTALTPEAIESGARLAAKKLVANWQQQRLAA